MSEQQGKYSRDADQTRYLWIVGIIGIASLLILFILELTAMIIFKIIGNDVHINLLFSRLKLSIH